MFIFEPGVAFWTILSFIFVLIFVQKYISPQMKKILDERKNNIEYTLEETQKNRQEAQQMFSEAEKKLRQVKTEEHKIISEAKEKARLLEKEYEKKALEKYRELQKKKEEDLVELEEKFLKTMEGHVAQIVIKACQKILRLDLTEQQKNEVVLKRIEELESLKNL
ncbi:MAG: F0F1 ATP synthase subunit B [Candidatus Margulisbacteria bacterium]|nr:F0F1 ATP synthase subunit B [Candidatus Margulisiibacteriota bacterium]